MKKALLLLLLTLSGIALRAQDAGFEAARALFREGRTLQAGRAFDALADATQDTTLRLRSLLAAGECWYDLDLTDQLSNTLYRIDALLDYRQTRDSSDWVIREAFHKLRGSYYLKVSEMDYTLLYDAEWEFAVAEEAIRQLRMISRYDSREAERVLMRERVSLYYTMGRYVKALDYSQKAFDLVADSGFGPDGKPTRAFAEAVSAHALVLARVGRFEEADAFLKLVPDWTAFPEYLRRVGEVAVLYHEDFPERPLDGAALDAYRRYRDAMLATVAQRFPSMEEKEREQYWLSLQPFLLDAYRLGDAEPEMLYDLALLSKGYLVSYAAGLKPTDWKSVRKALAKDECAVEFVEYAGAGDIRRMGALVLHRNDRKPRFIDLFDVSSLAGYEFYFGYFNVEEAMRDDLPYEKNILYRETDLYDRIWTPALQEAIGDARKIYFSPDGIFQALAIEYMLPESMDGRTAYRLSSTRKLIGRNRQATRGGNALLVGGVDFGAAIRPTFTGNDVYTYAMFLPSGDAPVVIDSLPGTIDEIDRIRAIRAHAGDRVLTRDEATDEAFCQLLPEGWDIVHVASHGFSAGTYSGNDLSPLESDPSMSMSGIILAGIESAVNNPDFNSDLYDGCLSSRELAQQDFSKVGLVVLSACQTALGYVSPEGVFGLQRGLKKAGADAMLLSLWSVNDYYTGELMTRFYREMASCDSLREALDRARASMVNDAQRSLDQPRRFNPVTKIFEPEDDSIDPTMGDPCYINAFILIDAF